MQINRIALQSAHTCNVMQKDEADQTPQHNTPSNITRNHNYITTKTQKTIHSNEGVETNFQVHFRARTAPVAG